MSYEKILEMLEYVIEKQYNWLVVDRDNNLYYKKLNQSITNNNEKLKNKYK